MKFLIMTLPRSIREKADWLWPFLARRPPASIAIRAALTRNLQLATSLENSRDLQFCPTGGGIAVERGK